MNGKIQSICSQNNRDSVSVISGANNRKIEDIRVGDFPWGIVVNERTETGYVVNSIVTNSNISVIDLGNNSKWEPNIPVRNGSLDIAVNMDTNIQDERKRILEAVGNFYEEITCK